eukprot:TRINITY_DN35020_c0_g1_i1.p1 TRINITY_DN35020_c0_g1~~TRINITY_DN35020_c0_g1_i1.p1  ORF type:complete len:209 (-),score=30.27 TRINITY_DN35020_c0_g1_i1:146-772(-)
MPGGLRVDVAGVAAALQPAPCLVSAPPLALTEEHIGGRPRPRAAADAAFTWAAKGRSHASSAFAAAQAPVSSSGLRRRVDAAASFLCAAAAPLEDAATDWSPARAAGLHHLQAAAVARPTAFSAEPLDSSAMGDFDYAHCSPGEAVRVGPDGLPYLVNINKRSAAQLRFALFIGVCSIVGCGAFAYSVSAANKQSSQAAPPADRNDPI